MTDKQILESAIIKYGFESQIGMCQEECTELSLAISKHRRYNNSDTAKDIIDEIILSQIRQENQLNPFDTNARGYIQCIVLNQFGTETTSTLEGFPIGIDTKYVVKG